MQIMIIQVIPGGRCRSERMVATRQKRLAKFGQFQYKPMSSSIGWMGASLSYTIVHCSRLHSMMSVMAMYMAAWMVGAMAVPSIKAI